MKNIITVILAIILLVSSFMPALAAEKVVFTNTLNVGYLPGDTTKSVTRADYISGDNAEVVGEGVRINAGGSATYGFSTRFGSRSVTFKFENASGVTTIKTKDNVYTTSDIKGSGEYTLVFGENLGIEPQPYLYNNQTATGYYMEYLENRGENEVTVSTTGGMYLKEMVFEKDKTPILENIALVPPAISEEEKVFMTTIIMNEMASAIIVNGGARYLDNNDTHMRPYKLNGTLYIPINTLAKALGYYAEDYPEKNYALMRSDTHEYVMLDGKHTISEGTADPQTPPFEAIIYHEGKTLAAVRYFAELIGETVVYDNGLIIMDDKYAVKNIMSSNSLLGYARSQISMFEDEPKIGKTYYVAQNSPVASDSNDGSAFTPFKTLEKAAKIATAGDTVIVHEGVYREVLKPANNGEATAPITFKAAEGENVVISANEEFYTWAKNDNGVYTTPMCWDMGTTRNQIFIDGEPLSEARHPNGPGILRGESVKLNNNLWGVRGDLYRVSGEDNRKTVRSATQLWQEEDHWKGGIFVGLFGLGYQMESGKIVKSIPGELTLGEEITKRWYTEPSSHVNYGYIVGHMNALDAPGEWIRQDDVLYMIFPEGKTPENSKVEAKARSLVVDLNDRKFVNIVGFDTIGGSVRMNNAEMCMMNGVNMKYISHFLHTANQHSGYIDFDYDGKLNSFGEYDTDEMDPNGAPERGVVGNYIAGKNNIFVNGSIDHSAGAGFYITGLYSYIENNKINDAGYMASYVSGIHIMSKAYENINTPRGGHCITNNTVYNAGRSLLNIEPNPNYSHVPFLPMNVGYNDFHDGELASIDTGLAYSYGVNMGYDGIMSNEHHNYVYLTTDAIDYNGYSYGIYHDGYSFGMDSFKNQIFYTQKGSGFSGHLLLEQPAKHAPANFLKWDNSKIGYTSDAVIALSESYFAEDRQYFAGCLQGVDYVENYNKFKEGRYGMDSSAVDAEASEGVTIDKKTGYASFTGDGQYIKFNDVDFGEESNHITLAVRGQYTNTKDAIEIIVGDDIETGSKYKVTAETYAPDRDVPHRIALTVRPFSGKQDVYVRVAEYNSVQIGGISTHRIDLGLDNQEYSLYLYAGNFAEWGKFDDNASTFSPPTPKYEISADPGSSFLNNTWPGYYVRYVNYEFTDDSDTFTFVGGSSGIYARQPVEIYIDGLKPENMVGEFIVEGEPFANKDIQVVPLDKDIKQGKHDVYLKFTTGEGYEKSSDFKYIGFVKKGVTLSEFKDVKVKVYGGQFDTSISKSNEEYPLLAEIMNPPNFTKLGLTYTLPGTVAGFKDVKIPVDATKFVINYSSEKGIDGQPIEVRLGSINSEPIASFVTEGNGLYNFNELTIELDEVVKSGEYDVYISFGGDPNAKLITKLDWFGFNN